MFTQQERIERRKAAQDAQHGKVVLDAGVDVVAGFAQQIVEAALIHEEGAAAGPQVVDLERDDDLGCNGAVVVEQIGLIRAHAVLEDDRGIDHRRLE